VWVGKLDSTGDKKREPRGSRGKNTPPGGTAKVQEKTIGQKETTEDDGKPGSQKKKKSRRKTGKEEKHHKNVGKRTGTSESTRAARKDVPGKKDVEGIQRITKIYLTTTKGKTC